MHVNLLSVVRIELFPLHRQPTDRELPIDQPTANISTIYILLSHLSSRFVYGSRSLFNPVQIARRYVPQRLIKQATGYFIRTVTAKRRVCFTDATSQCV